MCVCVSLSFFPLFFPSLSLTLSLCADLSWGTIWTFRTLAKKSGWRFCTVRFLFGEITNLRGKNQGQKLLVQGWNHYGKLFHWNHTGNPSTKVDLLAGDEKTAKSELWAPWDGHSGPLKHQMLALNIVMGENYYSAKMDGLTMFDILITK